ncbi:putative serine acetyltransferase 2 isoform X1 [Iris pallida]|uniref:Serine acetyltransferase 2 isoform X1 n=1 Tax=Iris pallida TaxID=29817 RepID=A0AAX6GLH6_IRIPA|nr:putative serine acetyltransferase 2 isoform X1 [Iris pallida]
MSCACLVLTEVVDDKEVKSNHRSSFSSSFPTYSSSSSGGELIDSRRCRSERIFPIYAMGSSDSNRNSTKVIVDLDSSEDPIWDSIKAEAKSEAEKEPVLSSFLYASVLSHDCLERALVFVLANRLQNPTLLATQLMDIFNDVMMNDRGIRRSIRLDVQAFKDRDPSCASYSWALLYLKGYHSLQSYRVAHALWNQGRKVLALALQSRISEVFAVDIHPAAKIGEGILLDHGTGLVIGETAVVGNKVSLMQARHHIRRHW